ncbi:hypothetical protein F6B41_34055 [Microbacterium lushaniae]|nr:hypothetical protein F6B41_34055 [Microbacterium lushaniae]
MEQALLWPEVRAQLSLDEVASELALRLLQARPAEQRKVAVPALALERPDLLALRWWPLLREELPAEAQRLPQELRHEREELEVEPPAWAELLPLRRPLEPLCEDLEERQHQRQPQELERRLDPVRWELDSAQWPWKLLPPEQEPLLLERACWLVQLAPQELELRLEKPLLDRRPLLALQDVDAERCQRLRPSELPLAELLRRLEQLVLATLSERELQESLLLLEEREDLVEQLLAVVQELQALEDQALVLHPQKLLAKDCEAQPVLHSQLHREQLCVREPLELEPRLPQPEELPLVWEERLEQLAEPLLERLAPQAPPLATAPSLDEEAELEEPRPLLDQPLPELPEELREEVALPQARPTLQRVWKRVLADPLLPAPPPRQWPLQQPEEPLEELVESRLEEHPQQLELEEPLALRQQALAPPRGEEELVLQRWRPRVPVELPQPVLQLWRELRCRPEEQLSLLETVYTLQGGPTPDSQTIVRCFCSRFGKTVSWVRSRSTPGTARSAAGRDGLTRLPP